VEELKYLGMTVTNQNLIQEEILGDMKKRTFYHTSKS
jgi:hypothetical protein